MTHMIPKRGWLFALFLALVIGAAGCGGGDQDADRDAGANGDATNQQTDDQAEEAQDAVDRDEGRSDDDAGVYDRIGDRDESSDDDRDRAGDDRGWTGDNAREDRDREEPRVVQRTIVVPAGSQIVVSLDQTLSTKDNGAGQTFTATTNEPVSAGGQMVFPAGSSVRGDILNASRAPNIGGRARMSLQFREVVSPNGQTYAIAAQPLNLQGESTTSGDIQKVLGGAIGGGVIGGVLGGKKGAGRGAAGGAAVGGVIAVATKGNDIVLPAGTDLAITLASDLAITVAGGGQDLP